MQAPQQQWQLALRTVQLSHSSSSSSSTPVRPRKLFIPLYTAKVCQCSQVLQVVALPPKLGVGEHAVQLVKVQVAAGTKEQNMD
jgi:hypothetical protein